VATRKEKTNFFYPPLLLLLLDQGSGMNKNQDWDKDPGSATLLCEIGLFTVSNLFMHGTVPLTLKFYACA
jgi:hypothetical protein